MRFFCLFVFLSVIFDRSGFYGSFNRYDRVIIWISYSRMKKNHLNFIQKPKLYAVWCSC